MKKRLILFIFFCFTFLSNIGIAKTLDKAFYDIFSKVLKQFSYEGEVVAIIPERDEAAVQFENNIIPPVGAEVTIYRHEKKLYNQLTGKFIGFLDTHVGIISIKDKVGTVAIGDIIDNTGHIKPGDLARFTKRVVFYVKGIKNLTDKPLQAYDVESYLELAGAKFPSIQIIFPNQMQVNINKQSKDVYYLNMKIFIKDTENPQEKDVSVEFSSFYTGMNIGVYSDTFKLSQKMLAYKSQTFGVGTSQQKIITPTSNLPTYPGLPVYPMGPQAQVNINKVPQYPNLPKYPKPVKKIEKKQQSKYKFTTLEGLKPEVVKFRKIALIPGKLKSIDFDDNRLIYSESSEIVYGEIVNGNVFRRLDRVKYKGFGQIMNVQFVDADGDGKKEVIENILEKDGMSSKIFKIKQNHLVEIASNINLILGGFDFDNDGKEELAGQTFDEENIFGDALYELKLSGSSVKRVKRVWIPFGFRLPSSVKADIDGDGKKELLFINSIHRLIVYKNGENIYTGDESLGGSFNIVSWNLGTEKFQYTKPQAIDPKPIIFRKDEKGREGVLIVKNYATGDIILGDIGLFKKGEVRVVYINNFGDVAMKPYSGKVDGAIEGITVLNNELVCGVIKKSAVNPLSKKASSFLIAFPVY